MSVGDYIVIGIVALLFVLAVISTVRYNRRLGCSGCSGDCSSCEKRTGTIKPGKINKLFFLTNRCESFADFQGTFLKASPK